MMNIAPHLDRQRLLTEDTADTRIVVLAKRAARSLLASGRPVTRSSLVGEAKRIDEKRQNKPHGLSEASIDANLQVREIYEAVRTWKAPRKSYRSGRIDPQIRRLTKQETITALLLGRLATQERMTEFDLATARYRGTNDTTAIARAFAEREAIRANRNPAKQPSGLKRATMEKREGSMRRINNAIRNGGSMPHEACEYGPTALRGSGCGPFAEDPHGPDQGLPPPDRPPRLRKSRRYGLRGDQFLSRSRVRYPRVPWPRSMSVRA
jgi:hypothetical protein